MKVPVPRQTSSQLPAPAAATGSRSGLEVKGCRPARSARELAAPAEDTSFLVHHEVLSIGISPSGIFLQVKHAYPVVLTP